MSVFNIAKIKGEYDNDGQVEVGVVGDKKGFSVTLVHRAGPLSYQFHLTPDQSRKLREVLEDAEAKAEILIAAI
jgi:hypothetical protein